jgi:hypothetical protein
MESTKVKVYKFAMPRNWLEVTSFANANGYEWGYLDGCRKAQVQPDPIPDGFCYAWLEYVRRHLTTSRMAIREGFTEWCSTETLPGLPLDKALDTVMEMDHVIQIHADGSITEPEGVYAPEVLVETDDDGQILARDETAMIRSVRAQGWTLLTGYTGQYGYRGPLMHPSEYIGGKLEEDMKDDPAYYVAVAVETLDDNDEPAGWVVARRDAS